MSAVAPKLILFFIFVVSPSYEAVEHINMKRCFVLLDKHDAQTTEELNFDSVTVTERHDLR